MNRLRQFPSLHRQCFDVIVVGGGHAGCEAAAAAARIGCKTALVTQKLSTVGEMSCNPAIGGVGKGTLVREIDSLDGLMGRVADASAIHFRVLNSSKGPAAWGPRAQMDRDIYRENMQKTLYGVENLSLIEEGVDDILIHGTSVKGIKTSSGKEIHSAKVVITTGTFLRGVVHIGNESFPAGRRTRRSNELEPPSTGLAKTLNYLGFPLARLKTGTPPRLDGSSIDYSKLEKQKTDAKPLHFSFMNDVNVPILPQITCFATFTNEKTHDIIRTNLSKLPKLMANDGKGVGPRYCPSIDSKIIRFADRTRHRIWLEPEGLNTNVVYPNGASTGLPADVQQEIINSMEGLENTKVLYPGYSVEYDYVDPRSLTKALETIAVSGLYFAGQINGTTGYEEAAGQGILAGINAGLAVKGEKSLVLDRDNSFIGVLIDDLTSLGTKEPYRMFTSRAEYRLSLRQDNCDLRLTRKGYEKGCVSIERLKRLEEKERNIERALNDINEFSLTPNQWSNHGILLSADGVRRTAKQILCDKKVSIDLIEHISAAEGYNMKIDESIHQYIKAECIYDSKLKVHIREMKEFRNSQSMNIPADVDYFSLPMISNEEKEILHENRPSTIYAASRISGVRPSTLSWLIQMFSKKGKEISKTVQTSTM